MDAQEGMEFRQQNRRCARETKKILLYFHRNVATYWAMYLELYIKEENSFLTLIKNLHGNIFAR